MSKITIKKSEVVALLANATTKAQALDLLCETYKMNRSNASKTVKSLDLKFGRQTVEIIEELEGVHV